MGRVETGFFTATVDGEPIYEGYILNGRPFVVKARRYGEVWYRGLLTEEEYQNQMLGNPFEYARITYGDRYLSHMEEFSRRIIERANGDFGRENVRLVFRELPEEHVRLVLGLPGDGGKTSFVRSIGGKVWTGKEAEALLPLVRNGRGEFLMVLVYPRYTALAGSSGTERFVVLTSRVDRAIDVLRRVPSGGGKEPERFNLEEFAGLGVPFARVVDRGDGTASIRTYRRIGTVIKGKTEVSVSLGTLKRAVKRYWAWVRTVERVVPSERPPHLTLPAWRKMVMAYLDDYPNPEDFTRILSVEAGRPVDVPTLNLLPEREAKSAPLSPTA